MKAIHKRRLLDILDTEEHWCKGTLARDKSGDGCCFYVDVAVSWCLIGAIALAARNHIDEKEMKDALELRARTNEDWFALWEWNDAPYRTFADVRRLIEGVKED